MDPILEHEATSSSDNSSKGGKQKHKGKKKKSHSENAKNAETVLGETRKFVVTTLTAPDQNNASRDAISQANVHTVHFGNRGVESRRPHVKSLFKEKTGDSSRPSSAERDSATVTKEYETFHGTSSSPRSSIFDIFRLRRKSDAKKHQSLMQNVKAALGGASKSAEAPESPSTDQSLDENKDSHKKYYHTVTGASSRKYSPITRVMDIFRSKPTSEVNQTASEVNKKKSARQIRRSSIGTTSPTYHKNSYAALDPTQAKQLFREVRGLPKCDPYLSIVQISLGGRDKTRLLLNFFKYHKCYEILPKSAKVIIFDTQFLVRKTFPTLISHGIRSAPLWDAGKKQLVGMITVTDFIRILLHLEKENLPMEDLERHTLHNWKRILRPTRKPLCFAGPDQSLHEAINMLNKNRVHRLLLIDPINGDVLYILSHKRILRFLFVYLNEFPELTFFHRQISELKIGTYDVVSVTEDTTIKDAFQILLDRDISALPILDDEGKLIDVYAKYEVLNLVNEKLYTNFSHTTLGEVRNKKKDWEEKLQKCHSSITLYEALEVIVRTESHRLWLVNKDDKLMGIVSLSDILVYLNRIIPSEKKVSTLQEIFRPLEENKVTESAKESENTVISIEVPQWRNQITENVPEDVLEVENGNKDESSIALVSNKSENATVIVESEIVPAGEGKDDEIDDDDNKDVQVKEIMKTEESVQASNENETETNLGNDKCE